MEKKYRHEYKYLSPEYILSYLQKRVGMVLQLDPHTGDAKQYSIRSIYFDDMYNTCYRENENGTDPREKFRIRIYNGSTEHIKLELKQKEKTKCFKYSALPKKSILGMPQKYFYTVCTFLVIGIIIGSFCDFNISKTLSNKTAIGDFFQHYGNIVSHFMYPIAGVCLRKT